MVVRVLGSLAPLIFNTLNPFALTLHIPHFIIQKCFDVKRNFGMNSFLILSFLLRKRNYIIKYWREIYLLAYVLNKKIRKFINWEIFKREIIKTK